MGVSTGDIIVNKKTLEFNASGGSEGISKEQIEKNKERIKSTGTTIEKPTDAKSILALDKNEDGSVKWTFDNIYENKSLAKVAKDYYQERTGDRYTDREAIDKFIWDRTFKQANTFSMGKEYGYITGKWGNAGADQRVRLA